MFAVIGSTTLDLYISGMETMPRFEGDEFTTTSLVFCNQPLTMALGGNGANSAYVLASLGAKTALCSAVGQDYPGDLMTGWLSARGIDLRGFLRSPSAGTPTTTAIHDHQQNRISFHHPGASWVYRYEDVPTKVLHEADGLLITGYTLFTGWRPVGYARALREAHQCGAITALDIGPAIGQPVQTEELVPMLPDVNYLFTNEYELSICTGFSDLDSGVHALIEAGAACIVVKRGKDGASIYTENQQTNVPGFPVEALVTVGAGDAFAAGFLFAIQRGDSYEQAALFGNATAALVVASGKSVLGCPTLDQINALMMTPH